MASHGPFAEDAAASADAGASPLPPVTIVVGHYGAGKTNLAINLAVDAAAAGQDVVLADLDVVNPYFRSSEYAAELEAHGVRVIAPVFGGRGQSLDSPSLSGAVAPAIRAAQEGGPALVIDAGGDDAGATALGRFAEALNAAPYTMLYVVNRYRNLTPDAAAAADVLREIEAASGLRATHVANNSHLHAETTQADIEAARPFGEEVAAALGLPLAFATVPVSVAERENPRARRFDGASASYPVQRYVLAPWEPSEA